MTNGELRDWRMDRALKQREAAERFGAKLSTYQKWEYGEIAVPLYVVKMIKLMERPENWGEVF